MDKFELAWRKMAEKVAFHEKRYSELTKLEKEFCNCMVELNVATITNSNVVSDKDIVMRCKPFYVDHLIELREKGSN